MKPREPGEEGVPCPAAPLLPFLMMSIGLDAAWVFPEATAAVTGTGAAEVAVAAATDPVPAAAAEVRGMDGAEAECWSGTKSAGGGGGASWGGGGMFTGRPLLLCCCSGLLVPLAPAWGGEVSLFPAPPLDLREWLLPTLFSLGGEVLGGVNFFGMEPEMTRGV